MVSYSRRVDAPADLAWGFLAMPAHWSAWAPHIRGAWGLGDPEVELGRTGAVRLASVVPVPARIVEKEPGRSWTWRVGPYLMEHRIEPRGASASEVSINVSGAAPLETALEATYGRLIDVLLGRFATVVGGAARENACSQP